MKRIWKTADGKKVIVVSTFSGMDLFLLGLVKYGWIPGYAVEKNFWAALMHMANFKHADGTPVIESFVEITKEEYKSLKTFKDEENRCTRSDEVGVIDGKYYRTKRIQDITGFDIRERIEQIYGKNIIIVLIGGPPCQDLTKLSKKKRKGESNRNHLLFEFLRIMDELRPDVAIMEEVPELETEQFKETLDEFVKRATELPYRIKSKKMNSILFGSNQQRVRTIFQFVHKELNIAPIFPTGDSQNVKRVKDFLDIDMYHTGTLTDPVKSKFQFMCTVTSGAPQTFWRGNKKYEPTIEELLLCMDVYPGDYVIPEHIPKGELRQAIGNGVCVSVAFCLAKTISEEILQKVNLDENLDGLCEQGNSAIEHDKKNDSVVTIHSLEHKEPNIAVTEKAEGNSDKPHVLNKVSHSRIINIADLKKMQFEVLNFTGRWAEFLGNPSANFNLILHGMAGEGKSTFAIKFAAYLAENFGRTIYISGEEGYSLTFKKKFEGVDLESGKLDIGDLNSVKDIYRNIEPNKYRFIFIDSLDNMRIGAEEMKHLRARYKNSSFITISQSTKDGLMRGSYELVHDADIAVRLNNGIAETTKNRFKEKGKQFKVF